MNRSGNNGVRLAVARYNRLFPPGYLKRYAANALLNPRPDRVTKNKLRIGKRFPLRSLLALVLLANLYLGLWMLTSSHGPYQLQRDLGNVDIITQAARRMQSIDTRATASQMLDRQCRS